MVRQQPLQTVAAMLVTVQGTTMALATVTLDLAMVLAAVMGLLRIGAKTADRAHLKVAPSIPPQALGLIVVPPPVLIKEQWGILLAWPPTRTPVATATARAAPAVVMCSQFLMTTTALAANTTILPLEVPL